MQYWRIPPKKNNIILSKRIIWDINLRWQRDFTIVCVNTCSLSLNSLKYLTTKIWDIVLYDIKAVENLYAFIVFNNYFYFLRWK